MSRLGKKPIAIPSGVQVEIKENHIIVRGPKGTLEFDMPDTVMMSQQDNIITLSVAHPTMKFEKAQWGLVAALVNNMIRGVVEGFEKRLEISGIGFRAELEGGDVVLYVGYTHPVRVAIPKGITVKIEKNTIIVAGIDKGLVGAAAASIRTVKPPEPYKGKGIKYQNEVVHRKAGKAVKAAAG